MRAVTVLFALTSAGCSQLAAASTITEFSRTAFQAALSSDNLSGQDFDSLPLGTIATVNGGDLHGVHGRRYSDQFISNDDFAKRPRVNFIRFFWT